MIKLLILGCPGTPIFEIADRFADFYDMDLFTVERDDRRDNSYFVDKIPAVGVDVGDLNSGSASQQMDRDPSALRNEKIMDQTAIEGQDEPLSEEEKDEILTLPDGILVTEIPDMSLVDWADNVLYLDADESHAIEWFSKRRKCLSCGSVFHLEDKPPNVPGICDRCGSDLIRRYEDSPSSVREQFRNWEKDFREMNHASRYGRKNYLRLRVDSFETFDSIISRINKWIKKTHPDIHPGWTYYH